MIGLDRYGLSHNPFDIVTDASIMADRQKELEQLRNSLSSAFSASSSKFIVLLGDYGSGKSHMLQYVYRELAQPGSKGVLAAMMGDQSQEVLYEKPLSIMESEPRTTKFGLSLVTRIFAALGAEKIASVLQTVEDGQFTGRLARLFLGLRDQSQAALDYLSGDALSPTELRELGVRSRLSDSPSGLAVYFEWLRYVAAGGYHSFLVLIDEVEWIALQSEGKVSQILNTFREVFDRGVARADPQRSCKSVFVLAFSPGGWDRLLELEKGSLKKTGGGGIAPFMERISPRDRIALTPFAIDDTRQLLSLRLDEARKAIPGGRSEVYPFTADAVRYLHEAGSRKPRTILQYAGIVLEDAADAKLDQVDTNDAKRILGKYGVQTPIDVA